MTGVEAGLLDDPYPIYAALRRDAPAVWDEARRVWVLSRYADVEQALSDPRLASAPAGAAGTDAAHLLALQLEMSDRPDHPRRRALVQAALAGQERPRIEQAVRRAAGELVAARAAAGRLDAVADLAAPLASRTLLHLLGVGEGETKPFLRCANILVASFAQASAATDYGFRAALDELLAWVEAAPRSGPGVARALRDVRVGGDMLSPEEVVANLVLLFGAGDGTTRNLVASGALALARHPAQAERLAHQPEGMEVAVEEMLRYDSPIQSVSRTAGQDLELHGQRIRRGDGVVLLLGSANRDEMAFMRAHEFDSTRVPNPHLAFGRGAHYCLGAWLARMEAAVALRTLLAQCASIQVAERVDWHQVATFRGPRAVPLVFESRTVEAV